MSEIFFIIDDETQDIYIADFRNGTTEILKCECVEYVDIIVLKKHQFKSIEQYIATVQPKKEVLAEPTKNISGPFIPFDSKQIEEINTGKVFETFQLSEPIKTIFLKETKRIEKNIRVLRQIDYKPKPTGYTIFSAKDLGNSSTGEFNLWKFPN